MQIIQCFFCDMALVNPQNINRQKDCWFNSGNPFCVCCLLLAIYFCYREIAMCKNGKTTKTNGQIMFAFTRHEAVVKIRSEKPTLYVMLKSMLDYVLQAPIPADRIIKDSIEAMSLSILFDLGFIKHDLRTFRPRFFGDMFATHQKGLEYTHFIPVRE